MPFDAVKSSENINNATIRINHQKRASTTEKYGPRQKIQYVADSTNSGGIYTLEFDEAQGLISEIPKSNGFISRNNNKTHSFGPISNENNL